MPIPRIIHQLWIGPKPSPDKLMDSWRDKNPDYEYIRWSESELEKRGFVSECASQIADMTEINGKADIYRWEILYKYGGIFVDADSICLEPFGDTFLEKTAFAGFENENVRSGLVATGTMGFIPGHPLCRAAIDFIINGGIESSKRAWYTVGPGLLTRLLDTGKFKDFSVYPSYYFIPVHFTGATYTGHKKVYAHQIWGNTKSLYDTDGGLPFDTIPEPSRWVSMLIPSYDTPREYLRECLDSIKSQIGDFGIELVWVNDGSSDDKTLELEAELSRFQSMSRFIKLKYINIGEHRGISYCLKHGIEQCSHELIFRMDSDDIMVPHRLKRQLEFMDKNKDCIVCGSNIQVLGSNQRTNHPHKLTWSEFKNNPSNWFMNHPTLCFKKTAVLDVGNYGDIENKHEDRDLEVKLLEKYGVIYNIEDCLVKYRLRGLSPPVRPPSV